MANFEQSRNATAPSTTHVSATENRPKAAEISAPSRIEMTDRWLRNLKQKTGRREYTDALVPGLKLRVSAKAKRWAVVVHKDGARTRAEIGTYPEMPLAEARLAARKLKDAAKIGAASSATLIASDLRRGGLAAPGSVLALCEGYITSLERNCQPSAPKVASNLTTGRHSFLVHLEGIYGQNVIARDVTPDMITEWLRATYARAPGQVRHARGDLHAAFSWAIDADQDYTRDADSAAFGLQTNPVALTKKPAPSKARNRVLSFEELHYVWRLLPAVASPRMTFAIRLMTAMGGLRISEIGSSQRTWYKDGWLHLPKTKNDRAHAVPLPPTAMSLVATLESCAPPSSPYLMPNERDVDRPMTLESFNRATKRIIDTFGLEPFQLRDLRRTMKTHGLERELFKERDIDIWHNHGQNADVARKHYDWAEHRAVKLRLAEDIERLLTDILAIDLPLPDRPDRPET